MRVQTVGRLETWIRGGTLFVLMVLAWAVLVPGALFWTAGFALGLVGITLATTLLVRSRRVPTLAQVIATAEAEPALVAGRGRSTAAAAPGPREGR
jgi:hypothetical protein